MLFNVCRHPTTNVGFLLGGFEETSHTAFSYKEELRCHQVCGATWLQSESSSLSLSIASALILDDDLITQAFGQAVCVL